MDERNGVCGNQPIDFTNQNGIEASVVANLNPYLAEVQECGDQLTILKDHDDWSAIEIGVEDGGRRHRDAPVAVGMFPPDEGGMRT